MDINYLDPSDIEYLVHRLPTTLRKTLEELSEKQLTSYYIAGGFIRACIANESVNDIDIFLPINGSLDIEESKKSVRTFFLQAKDFNKAKVVVTDNAITVCVEPAVQFITRSQYVSPIAVINSFDFTIAQAALYCEGKNWVGICSPLFYQDVASKRLRYTSPNDSSVIGSLMRVLKFTKKGYHVDSATMPAIVGTLVAKYLVDDTVKTKDQAIAKLTEEYEKAYGIE